MSYTIDSTTGALTEFANRFAAPNPTTAAVDPTGRFLYVASGVGRKLIFQYSIDNTTGAVVGTSSPLVETGLDPDSMAIDPSGRFAYLVNEGSSNISGYTLDSATGGLTPIPGSPFAADRGPSSLAIASSSSAPFEAFKAKVEIDQDRKTSFRVEGLFTLGEGNNSINPVAQNVEL